MQYQKKKPSSFYLIKLYFLLLDCQTWSSLFPREFFFPPIFHWPTDNPKKKKQKDWEQAAFLKHTQVSFSLTWSFPQREKKKAMVCPCAVRVCVCVWLCVRVWFTDKATDVSVQSVGRAAESILFFPCHIKWLKTDHLFPFKGCYCAFRVPLRCDSHAGCVASSATRS